MPTPCTHACDKIGLRDSTCDILSPRTSVFWVSCDGQTDKYMSRANDVSQAASKQSCNGRDGEKLERKKCKKAQSPRRSNDRSGHAQTCLIELDILQHIHAAHDAQVGWRITNNNMLDCNKKSMPAPRWWIGTHAHTCLIELDILQHIHATHDAQVGWRSTKNNMLDCNNKSMPTPRWWIGTCSYMLDRIGHPTTHSCNTWCTGWMT